MVDAVLCVARDYYIYVEWARAWCALVLVSCCRSIPFLYKQTETVFVPIDLFCIDEFFRNTGLFIRSFHILFYFMLLLFFSFLAGPNIMMNVCIICYSIYLSLPIETIFRDLWMFWFVICIAYVRWVPFSLPSLPFLSLFLSSFGLRHL